MIIATSLELLLLLVVLTSHDAGTRILGGLLWCAYFYYSATWAAVRAIDVWLNDRNNPPPGAA
jgi:hypothetical protein